MSTDDALFSAEEPMSTDDALFSAEEPMSVSPVRPGEVLPADGEIRLNPGRPVTRIVVVNTGDRPIQVGSHYHFAAANPALSFDREAAWGMRLDVPAGTGARFEPGIDREVDLVPLAGNRVVPGLRPESAGPLDDDRG